DPDIPSFAGGAIGYMDFDCAEWFEPTLKNAASKRSGKASGTFMFYRSLVAFDHV
ncbi:MAG TPA: aminodeoxychorismate synthase component I, partial [Blastocatellia bacterium]|nr:aminodeoxychorismate synthase component I [Blastocatellia bacterium]